VRKPIPKKFIYLALGCLSLATVCSLLLILIIETSVHESSLAVEVAPSPKEAIAEQRHDSGDGKESEFVRTQQTVEDQSTASETLKKAGLGGPVIRQLIEAAKPHTNLANIASNAVFSLYWNRAAIPELRKLEYPMSKLKSLLIEKDADSQEWKARVAIRQVETRTEAFLGTVDTSLWNSAVAAGIDSSVISQLSNIFAWQVNFSREIHTGDSWRLTIERKYLEGKPLGWGNILAAEFANGVDTYSAVRFAGSDGIGTYYDRAGESLRRLFLKSPVPFSHISSGFTSRRMHPILKVNRPHNGVDYSAPAGTPVHAVGAGVVAHASYDSASGNMIKINHNATYSTSYHHLSKFASNMRVGQRISQGDLVGFVGSTGLATGPHLHFAFYERGVYVDPQGIKFPAADPISPAKRPEFIASATAAINKLPAWNLKLAQAKVRLLPNNLNFDETPLIFRAH
jgi:murein DD-endopeptidase MepM/ murein hydrolase activator NlpD